MFNGSVVGTTNLQRRNYRPAEKKEMEYGLHFSHRKLDAQCFTLLARNKPTSKKPSM
jgi:hypothetical protein